MFVLKRGRCCFTKRLVHQHLLEWIAERRLFGMKCRWRFYFHECARRGQMTVCRSSVRLIKLSGTVCPTDKSLNLQFPNKAGDVVQLVRTLPCHGRGREFESRRPRQLFNNLQRSTAIIPQQSRVTHLSGLHDQVGQALLRWPQPGPACSCPWGPPLPAHDTKGKISISPFPLNGFVLLPR